MSDEPLAVSASVLLPHEVLHAFYVAGKTQALLFVCLFVCLYVCLCVSSVTLAVHV